MSDELNILNQLESKIQKLMSLHEDASMKVLELHETNKSLGDQLEAERNKVRKVEKEMEAFKVTRGIQHNETVGVLKNKVNDIIREIDNNLSVMNNKTKK